MYVALLSQIEIHTRYGSPWSKVLDSSFARLISSGTIPSQIFFCRSPRSFELSVMFVLLVTIGGLGFSNGDSQKTAVAILFVISTLVNMISVGPVCYPIVAETPSGRLRYKTVVIGRFVYNLTGIFSNSVTPRMVSPIGSSAYSTLYLNI